MSFPDGSIIICVVSTMPIFSVCLILYSTAVAIFQQLQRHSIGKSVADLVNVLPSQPLYPAVKIFAHISWLRSIYLYKQRNRIAKS